MKKSELRSLYKQKRRMLSSSECILLNQQILNQLITLDLSNVHYLHLYLSIRRHNEPDTLDFAKWIRRAFPTIRLVVSKSNFVDGSMQHFLWDDTVVLAENVFGILEPTTGCEVEETLIDMVLVPLLVADRLGNRVGYGKGFYDRFLEKCRPDVQTVGVSYFPPIPQIADTRKWDVPLKKLITPQEVFLFS